MFRIVLIFILSTPFFTFLVKAQSYYTFSGYVRDTANGEDLVGSTLYVPELKKGTATNEYGFFSLSLPEGNYQLQVSYVGFATKTIRIDLKKSLSMNIGLGTASVQTEEVIVTTDRADRNVRSTEMSRAELSAERIKSLPVVLGESDVLKAITLLPGIKSGGEGNTGFYVRGGGPDQNLILMDEAVVYNPSHLLGFMSVFNTDAIKNAEIIKGGMPANYGGRLSSILNVHMREGNNQKMAVSGGVGLIASRLTIEGPIQKNKSSFIASGRRTYIDALAQPFLKGDQKGNGYYFYDFNLKLNYIISAKDKIFLSGYLGRDKFVFRSPRNSDIVFRVSWGNSIASLRWNHVFNPKLFVNTALVYNRYDLNTSFQFNTNEFSASSGLRDWNLKSDFEYYPNARHKIKFGYNYTWHTFVPGISSGRIGNNNLDQEISRQYAHEAAFYAQDDFALTDKILFNLGMRYVFFNQVGPYTSSNLDDDGILTGETETWKTQESIAFYQGLEPRAAATYLLTETSSLKASYTRTNQFLHLATTSGASFPSDLWMPSSRLVKPQMADQVALGYFRNFKDNTYETSAEVYYKTMRNQVEFRPGARLFLNQNLENEVITGKGEAYGAEFFLKKRLGKLNGWIGYTWSKTTRQFDLLNGGKTFFYRYDRRHDVSLVVSYELSKRWSANFVFVYGTGSLITLPTSRFVYQIGVDNETFEPKFNVVNRYEGVNNYRLPAYHRADVSFTYARKKNKRFQSSWVFSIYNLYNRKNPYFIYFEPDLEEQTVKAYMVYLFPILPSALWNFNF